MVDLNDIWTIENVPANIFKKLPLYMFCSFPVTKGIYFYEVTLLSGNKMQIGYATRLTFLNQNYEIENTDSSMLKTFDSCSNEIFGCLINVEEKIIKFYCNGSLIDVQTNNIFFKFKPFFAVIKVAILNKIHINFGQKIFKYSPFETNFKTFYSIFVEHYNSHKTNIENFNNLVWIKNDFKYICSNNTEFFQNFVFGNFHLNFEKPFFSDKEQIEFDLTVYRIEEMINNENTYSEIKTFVYNTILNSKKNDSIIRFIQSLIEVAGKVILTNKTKMFENCIVFIFSSKNLFEYFKHLKHFKDCLMCFHSFLFYYFSKFTNINLNEHSFYFKTLNFVKIINIFIIFLFKLKSKRYNDEEFCCTFLKSCCNSFFKILFCDFSDNRLKLYSIMYFYTFQKQNKNFFCNDILKELKIWIEKFNNTNELNAIKNISKNKTQLQLYLFANAINQEIIKKEPIHNNNNKFTYPYYTMWSPFTLMARNHVSCENTNFATIFSKFSINSNSFYFEVSIITSGEMRIGLTTQTFNKNYEVGSDIFSIGIDGFNKCVWKNNKQYKFKNKMFSWKAGDIISIYIDKFKRTVIFGINKQIIELNGDPFEKDFCFSEYPLHVAVNLAMFQQCFFNFDCKIVPQEFLNKLKTITANYQWSVINDHHNYSNKIFNIWAISSFAIIKGAYYYEVKNLFGNKIQTGWITRWVEYKTNEFIVKNAKNDAYSSFLTMNSKPGDIIGCYVNVEQKTIIFYCNGQQIDVQVNKTIFDCLPIFSSTSVEFSQNIQFNFGQRKFEYPPIDKQFSTFYFKATQNIFKIDYNFSYFCTKFFIKKQFLNYPYPLIISHVFKFSYKKKFFSCIFKDSPQKQFNDAVLKIENMINSENDYNIICQFIFNFLKKSEEKYKQLRFIQSVVEIIGNQIEKNKIDKLDYCIMLILKNLISLKNFKNLIHQHNLLNHYFLYFNSENDNEKNKTKIHYFTLCILALQHNKQFFHCCEYMQNKSESFFYNILLYSNDSLSQLYSFMLFKIWSSEKISIIENNHDLWINKFNQFEKLKNIKNINKFSSQCQLYFYANYYQTKYFMSKTNKNNHKYKTVSLLNNIILEEMNPKDKTKHIMLSSNKLIVRNDHISNQTIRSQFSVNPIDSSAFYFETTIVTVGSMRIGFAAKQMSIAENVGDNAFSIGIDGYNQCVWMHKKKYKFQNPCSHWMAGDVIGIYVSFEKKNVVFGINENIIELDKNPFEKEFIFSVLPCHVAVTLSQYQQCLFNFKCTVIPLVFSKKLKILSQNVPYINNAVVITDSSSVSIRDINIIDLSNQANHRQNFSYSANLDSFLKNDETTSMAFKVWATANKEISLAYNRILSGSYRRSGTITLNTCEQWCDQMETIFSNLKAPELVHFEDLSRKIGKIRKMIKKDDETQIKKNMNNFSLMLMPASVHLRNDDQLIKSKFKSWLENLQVVLCSEGVAKAIESPLKKNDPLNLIARGRILLLIPQELQAPLERIKVAFYMMEALEEKFCKSPFFTKQAKSSKRKFDQISQ